MKDLGQSADTNYLVTPKQRRQAATRRTNAKFEEIRDRLHALAVEKGPGSQLPTIRELCTLLNTSSVTLTAALDLLETERVLYRKERQGIFVSEKIHEGTIHVLFNINALADTNASPFWTMLWSQILQEFERRASFKQEQYQFHFLFQPFGRPIPDAYLPLLHAPNVRGCILIGMNARTANHKRLLEIPHVAIAGGGDIVIQGNFGEAFQIAIQALQQQGCQKLACWFPLGFPTDQKVDLEETVEGRVMLEKLQEMKIPLHTFSFKQATTPIYMQKQGISKQEQGYLLVKEVFGAERSRWPDGIYILDDMLTSGALIAWEELGLAVGSDFKVVSQANVGSPILFGRTKQISLIEDDTSDWVRALFSFLDQAMSGGYKPTDQVIQLPARLRLQD
ncbi:GntR family transcriptional regulator [Tengunoibacter tsumagoiensis]|uniref:HTH gntR-type domain-containing protein n=1 Tax=Tengunoibacter tsumagoiensis TaxID=2014871 RepID=A0A401ZWQ0_9CHLR|nr:GntR family transcriptional regulator [Tengunoibacter tsumagoiensis]GCE11164.1 hypothetical protein KTT_10230 [Tengunoibacter tsumagoiensis]